jgi:hypothetical protein
MHLYVTPCIVVLDHYDGGLIRATESTQNGSEICAVLIALRKEVIDLVEHLAHIGSHLDSFRL